MATDRGLTLLSRVIGEQLTRTGGVRMTRLTQAASAGQTTLTVERTAGLAAKGRVLLDGIVYQYAAIAGSSLTGVGVMRGGLVQSGVQKPHLQYAPVVDANRNYSLFDLIKNGLFIDTAEGPELATIGRNLGVPRLPSITSDAQYRALIKASAYKEKSTPWAMEKILGVILGDDNFSLSEDPIDNPGKVYVDINYGDVANEINSGRSYLTGDERVKAASGVIAPRAGTLLAYGLRLADAAYEVNCRTQLPSGAVTPMFAGDVTTGLLKWFGSTNTTEAANGNTVGTYFGAQQTKIPQLGGIYSAELATNFRLDPSSTLRASIDMRIDNPADLSSTDGRYWMMALFNATTVMAVALFKDSGDNSIYAAACDRSTGIRVAGSPILKVPTGQAFELGAERTTDTFRFWVNNQRRTVSNFPKVTTAGGLGIVIGSYQQVTGGNLAQRTAWYVSTIRVSATNSRDYTCSTGTNASVSSSLKNEINISSNAAWVATAPLNTLVVLSGGALKNSYGGNNNGTFFTESGVSTPANIKVYQTKGTRGSLSANQVFTADDAVFTYPNDLGRSITITDGQHNVGATFTVKDILDPVSRKPLSNFATPLAQKSSFAVVAEATGVAASGLSYTVRPAFVNESALTYVAGTPAYISNGNLVLGQPLPTQQQNGYYAGRFDIVSGAQVFATHELLNPMTTVSPRPIRGVPLYVTDLLGPAQAFVNKLNSSGVTPVFRYN